ncbi:uncharacterized protein CTRU02_215080 [Colletotrichum truncatum]|uniref:Uncharacterized protein n=1 Tax=Colletotrichum truncatum TaxID=5467 RepID=A0ACC3YDE1_COLTU
MSSLDVEIACDAMLVEIELPLVYEELFSDYELLIALKGSPYHLALKKLPELVAQNKDVKPLSTLSFLHTQQLL